VVLWEKNKRGTHFSRATREKGDKTSEKFLRPKYRKPTTGMIKRGGDERRGCVGPMDRQKKGGGNILLFLVQTEKMSMSLRGGGEQTDLMPKGPKKKREGKDSFGY